MKIIWKEHQLKHFKFLSFKSFNVSKSWLELLRQSFKPSKATVKTIRTEQDLGRRDIALNWLTEIKEKSIRAEMFSEEFDSLGTTENPDGLLVVGKRVMTPRPSILKGSSPDIVWKKPMSNAMVAFCRHEAKFDLKLWFQACCENLGKLWILSGNANYAKQMTENLVRQGSRKGFHSAMIASICLSRLQPVLTFRE